MGNITKERDENSQKILELKGKILTLESELFHSKNQLEFSAINMEKIQRELQEKSEICKRAENSLENSFLTIDNLDRRLQEYSTKISQKISEDQKEIQNWKSKFEEGRKLRENSLEEIRATKSEIGKFSQIFREELEKIQRQFLAEEFEKKNLQEELKKKMEECSLGENSTKILQKVQSETNSLQELLSKKNNLILNLESRVEKIDLLSALVSQQNMESQKKIQEYSEKNSEQEKEISTLQRKCQEFSRLKQEADSVQKKNK